MINSKPYTLKNEFYIVLVYFIIGILYVCYIQFEWVLSADGYAESVTNYYRVAHSNLSLFEQFIARDYGYASPLLRIIPYICSFINIERNAELIIYNFFSVILSISLPAIIIHKRYSSLISSTILRVIFAIFLFVSLNFESRLYHNISIIFAIPVFIILFTALKKNSITSIEKFLVVILIMGKPFSITLIVPLIYLIYTSRENKYFYLFLAFLILSQIFFIYTYSIGSSNISNAESFINLIILLMYNFVKLFTLGIMQIILKIYPEKSIVIIFFTIFFGLITFFIYVRSILKEKFPIIIFSIQIIINILWAFMIIYGTKNFSLYDNQFSVDFNRYDIITAFNLLCIIIVANNSMINYEKQFILLLSFVSLIYASACIYQYNYKIKNNIYYIGSSTWSSVKKDNYFECSLLSPLGLGDNCIIKSNVQNRNLPPNIINKTGFERVHIKSDVNFNKVIIFENDNSFVNIPLLYLNNFNIIKPNVVQLFNGNRALIYNVRCLEINNCLLNFKFSNNKIYYYDMYSPVIIWF